MRYTDRSRTEKDWRCPRARFWNTEFGGTGIVPARKGFDLEFGTIVHDEVEAGVLGDTQCAHRAQCRTREFLAAGGAEAFEVEQWGAIAFGLVVGFLRSVWPKLVEEYELVSTEREVLRALTPGITLQARPDLVLRHRTTKQLWNCELKTTGYIEAQWLQSWTKAPQLQLTVFAAEEEFQESFAGSMVIGLYKGRKGRERQQSSPFAWGWRSEEIPGVMGPQFSYEEQRRKGWEKFLTVHAPNGVEGWVAGMPEELLARQFVQTEPIFLRRDLLGSLVNQIIAREEEIAGALVTMGQAGVLTPDVMDRVFPQAFNNCTPSFGHACEYLEACWVPFVNRDPLSSGLFAVREPHHEAERKVFALRRVA